MKNKSLFFGDKINRSELRKIIGGENIDVATFCSSGPCSFIVSGCGNQIGHCEENSIGQCICVADCVSASIVSEECQAA